MRIKIEGGSSGIGTQFLDSEGNDISKEIDARSVDIRIRSDDVVTAEIETYSHGIDIEVLKEHAKVLVGPVPFADDIAEEIIKELGAHSEVCAIYEGEGYEGSREYIKGLIVGVIDRESEKEHCLPLPVS